MEQPVLSTDGTELRRIELSDKVFGRKVSEGLIYHAVRNELANARVGTAQAKTRAQVRGTNKKPWRQKGTGRARAGTRKSPIWVGGGIVFGPQQRDYTYNMPRRQKRAAMFSILSMKARGDQVLVVEDVDVSSGKTKDLVRQLSKVSNGERTVLIVRDEDALVKRAARNVPWLRALSYNRLSAHTLFYGERIILTESAARLLSEYYEEKV
jgi:large subunit ribosomal protein L4